MCVPSVCPFTLLWLRVEAGLRPTGRTVLSEARFCGRGRPMYCESMACNGGNFGALAGHGGGNTGGMNQGKAPAGPPDGSAPGTPPAVWSRRA